MIDEIALEQRISSSAAEQWRKQQHIPRVPASDRNDTRSPARLGRSHGPIDDYELAQGIHRELLELRARAKSVTSVGLGVLAAKAELPTNWQPRSRYGRDEEPSCCVGILCAGPRNPPAPMRPSLKPRGVSRGFCFRAGKRGKTSLNLSQNYGLGSIGYKCRMIRLSDEQWERIRDHFPEEHIADGHPGRKPIPTRRVLQAVLWILNTGAQWHMLPQSYPNYKTVHRRFQTWCSNEVLRRVLTDVANELRDKGVLDEEESFIDATFAMAKGGGAEIGPTKRGKGMKIMAIVDRHGLPLSVSTHAANHHEVRLVQLCFDFYMIEAKPETLRL